MLSRTTGPKLFPVTGQPRDRMSGKSANLLPRLIVVEGLIGLLDLWTSENQISVSAEAGQG
jgi:hypothetical protein